MKITFNGRAHPFAPWKPEMGQVFESIYALDTETAAIDEARDWLTPPFVLGAAFGGERGYFLQREHVGAFLDAHREVAVVCHNAAFDLAVLHLVAPGADVYDLVERNQVWDTQLLHRLYALATQGHAAQGKGQSTLEHCAAAYLGAELPKELEDSVGDDVRLSWGKWLGK